MKRIIAVIILSFMTHWAYSQCNAYYNFEEGAEYEMTHYNKKGKKTGKTLTRILSLKEDNGVMVATVQGISYDKKDKEISQMEYEYRCEDGVLKLDLSTMIPREQFEKNPEVEFEMSGDFLEIPSDLKVGEKLPDGSLTGKMILSESGPMASMDMTVDVKNRRVDSREEVSTELGSFTCMKITYDLNVSTKMMGMNISNESSGIDFITEGIGVIRTESYDKKGKLSGYSVLTAHK